MNIHQFDVIVVGAGGAVVAGGQVDEDGAGALGVVGVPAVDPHHPAGVRRERAGVEAPAWARPDARVRAERPER